MGMISMLITWGRDLSGMIWPRTCEICGRSLIDGEDMLCLHCLSALPRTYLHRLDFNSIHQRLAGGAKIERAGAFITYRRQGDYSALIRRGKYNNRPDLLRKLAAMYVNDLNADNFFDGIDVILPVPMHSFKRIKRGYNQSVVIAESLSAETGVPLGDNLKAAHGHSTQTRRSAIDRYFNVKDIFYVDHPDELTGMHILVVDDVITSGATLLSCARVISRFVSGARISVLTLASSAI